MMSPNHIHLNNKIAVDIEGELDKRAVRKES